MYQCETINASTNACEHWVEVGFLGLPDITSDEAYLLCGAIATVLVSAFLYKLIARFIHSF